MKPFVIALALCAGTTFAGTAAADCSAHGSKDALAPVKDKAAIAQNASKPAATPVATLKLDKKPADATTQQAQNTGAEVKKTAAL